MVESLKVFFLKKGSQKIETIEVLIRDLLSCRKLPVLVAKSFKIDASIDDFIACIKQFGPLASERSCAVAWTQQIQLINAPLVFRKMMVK